MIRDHRILSLVDLVGMPLEVSVKDGCVKLITGSAVVTVDGPELRFRIKVCYNFGSQLIHDNNTRTMHNLGVVLDVDGHLGLVVIVTPKFNYALLLSKEGLNVKDLYTSCLAPGLRAHVTYWHNKDLIRKAWSKDPDASIWDVDPDAVSRILDKTKDQKKGKHETDTTVDSGKRGRAKEVHVPNTTG